MNRRIFLHKGSLAALAIAGLPKAIRTAENTPSLYKTELKEDEAGQWYYEIGLYHTALKDFKNAPAEEKVLGLKVKYFETDDQTNPTTTGEYKYIIRSCEQVKGTTDTWKITTKLDKKISGDHQFSKEYPKNLSFICKAFTSIDILDKKDNSLVNVPYPPAGSSEGGDCFLTTACVQYKGLPDNCDELETLRYLRDQHMIKNEEGRLLVTQYAVTGPEIVTSINRCDNKREIYEYMHQYMILPSMELIKQGKYDEAIYHYKAFVQALEDVFC